MNSDVSLVFVEINNNPALQAALYHRSGKTEALDLLAKANLAPAVIDHWETFGKAVIELYAANSIIGSTACESVGKASLTINAVRQQIYYQISRELLTGGHARFGDSMPESDRASLNVIDAVTNQIVGGLCYFKGLTETRKSFLVPLAPLRDVEISSGKDSKTLLQELCQSRHFDLAKYTLVATTGPAHSQSFVVRVTAAGRTAEAEGRSKRLAEQSAAAAFLNKHFPSLKTNSCLTLYPGFDITKAANSIPRLPNAQKAKELVRLLELPDWSVNLLSLAFTRPSYVGIAPMRTFGKDNEILALLGSHVLQWSSKDAVIRTMDHADIALAGGLAALSNLALKDEKLVAACSDILHDDLYLIGPSEKSLRLSLKSEMVQAFVGVLYLARARQIATYSDLFTSTPMLQAHFSECANGLKSSEEFLDAKTRLQERCQAIGVAVSYETERTKSLNTFIIETCVKFSSPWMPHSLRAALPKQNFTAHLAPSNMELEQKIANILIDAFDFAAGSIFRSDRKATMKRLGSIERWLLNHMLAEVSAFLQKGDEKRSPRLFRIDILGVAHLRSGNFYGFEEWLRQAAELLGEDVVMQVERLIEYYVKVGKVTLKNVARTKLLDDLKALESLLTTIDPIKVTVDVKNTLEFRALVQQATALRLLGGKVVEISLDDFLAQSRILFKRRATDVRIISKDSGMILEIEGAHMALLNLIIQTSEDMQAPHSMITLSNSKGALEVAMEKSKEHVMPFIERFSSSATWVLLNQLLPIVSVQEDDIALKVTIPSLTNQRERSVALKCWWSFQFSNSPDFAAKDAMATVLHDMKNEILACMAASYRAQESQIQREKYQIAADASRHLEQALRKLEGARLLLQSTQSLPVQPISMNQFVRSLVTELWSWIPTGISFLPPTNLNESTIWTNEGGLHSIIINLARNAIDAMDGNGRLEIDYLIYENNEGVEFEISDTGPGFSEGQLEMLNNGISIGSSKQNGSGIGLLSVLMLTKELGGSVEFSRNTKGGSRITVCVPSLVPESESMLERDFVQINADVGEKAIVE